MKNENMVNQKTAWEIGDVAVSLHDIVGGELSVMVSFFTMSWVMTIDEAIGLYTGLEQAIDASQGIKSGIPY